MHRNHLLTHRAFSEPSDLSYEEMEEDLTCPVCLELYADPLMMPCSHSVCKVCLHDIMKCRAKTGKQNLECPACRKNHHLTADEVNKLPKNLALENIVFRYQEIRSCSLSKASQLDTSDCASPSHETCPSLEEQDTVFEDNTEDCHCGMCEDSDKHPAAWFCQQCQVLYCQPCLDTYHPKKGSLSKHKIRKPTIQESVENMLNCKDHKFESATIFCDTCKVVACHLCVCQGQGSHCNHVILDLETARKKLKDTVQAAKNDLSQLITSFSDRGGIIDSQIQEIQDIEESARNNISSQYNCILSDIAATLTLVKRKSLESVTALTSKHSSHLYIHSQQVKALLDQCENLDVACEGLLSEEEQNTSPNETHIPSHPKHSPNTSNISVHSDGKINTSFSSMDESIDDEAPSSDTNTARQTVILPSSKANHRKSNSVPVEATEGRTGNLHHESLPPTSDKKVTTTDTRDDSYLKRRSASESKEQRLSNLQDEKSRRSVDAVLMKQLSAGNLSLASKTKHENTQEKLKSLPGTREKYEDLAQARKSFTDKKNSQRKMCGDQELKSKQRKSDPPTTKSDAKYQMDVKVTETGEKSLAVHSDEGHRDSVTKVNRAKDRLLLRADEVGPVVEQVAALLKESQYQSVNEGEASQESEEEEHTAIMSCVSNFHTSSLAVLSHVADQPTEDCPVITPTVRSVVSPAHLSQAGAPRVQSRTLITWGFNSTTFTADKLEECAQWSVNISKNTSHIGDINSGYLFGVGVSARPLSSKEQVGMTGESHAIVCIGGQLAVCHDSTHTAIMPLSDLPLSVTITVTCSKAGLVMAYKLMLNGTSNVLCGRRVIALHANTYDQNCKGEGKFDFKVHPVFTVSQRVKMQFPISSDV